MAATYKQFLAAPNPALLADKASLHYVTTLNSFQGADAVFDHLNVLKKQVNKKKEEVLNSVEGQSAVVLEIETALEFKTSGGTYLPNLDDNFLSDRVASLVITHFVSFDEDGRIVQIRQQWDQGSLLKQLDVIGKSGRNWPIRDSREQISLIQTCIKASGEAGFAGAGQNSALNRARGNSSNVLRDPHASLHNMSTREEIEAEAAAAIVSPYAGGVRTQQRSFADFMNEESGDQGSPSANRQKFASPSKAGQGKNFQPMRLFEGQEHNEDEEEETPKKTEKKYIRPDPTKYNHFDFVDPSDPQNSPQRGVAFEDKVKTKRDSQWSFDDFTTPQKILPSRTNRTQDVRHWETDSKPEDILPSRTNRAQEVRHWETDSKPEESHAPGKGRKDAENHIELQDDGERDPHQERPVTRPRGSTHNEGLGLYKNQLFDKDPEGQVPERALGNITNLKNRGKTFDSHFDVVDESPAHPVAVRPPVPENRKKAVKMMDHSWNAYDDSPTDSNQRLGQNQENTRIHIAGDGMGGKKGTNRNWFTGDGEEEATPKPAARKPNRAAQEKSEKSFWDF